MFTVEQASRLYRIPVIDWERPGRGLLIASGSGLMMSVMDAVPSLRWSIDFDGLDRDNQLASFLELAERAASVVGMCGWFTITEPARIAPIVSRVGMVVYGGNVRFGVEREARSLADFVRMLAP